MQLSKPWKWTTRLSAPDFLKPLGMWTSATGPGPDELQRVVEAEGALLVGHRERHHAAEARHLAPGQLVIRMAGQPGMEDPLHAAPLGEPARDPQRRRALPLDAHRQRLQPAQ